MADSFKAVMEVVVKEFPPLGKYRVRILEHPKTHQKVLDIREFVSNDSFSGYTRRGIRLSDKAQIDLLRDVLGDVLQSMER
jgi:hypothetical protein